MIKKILIGISMAFLLITTLAIVITNLKYNKDLKPTELSVGDKFEASGYNLSIRDYKVLTVDELEQYIVDLDQFEAYKNMFEFEGYVVLVSATLKVTDKESMNKDWWTDYILYSDNAWRNPPEVFLTSLIKDANPAKGNYVNGEEYELIFPFVINKNQVPEHDFNNAKNWKYSFIYGQNPIVYVDINKE